MIQLIIVPSRLGRSLTFNAHKGVSMANKISAGKKSKAAVPRKPIVVRPDGQSIDWETLLGGLNGGKSVLEYAPNRNIFRQGDPADAVFYIKQGDVKLSVTSQEGKEAIVATLSAGDFFGEGCLAGQPLRIATAISVSECTLMKIDKKTMTRMLHVQHDISELFVTHLLARNIRFEGDLVDQLFNSSEKRLARILLLLARFGKENKTSIVLPRINQEHLSQMVGTTRSRVSHFMNKFKTLGFIDYTHSGDLTVNNGLLSVVLHD
jgi:CRP/FNR family transcriptional regulator, cyclic AMP receptor protein